MRENTDRTADTPEGPVLIKQSAETHAKQELRTPCAALWASPAACAPACLSLVTERGSHAHSMEASHIV